MVFLEPDWYGCEDQMHSTSGAVLTLHKAPVVWKSEKQTVVALSSVEAEYIAMSHSGKDVTWICLIVSELTGLLGEKTQLRSTIVMCDNTAAL